MSAVNRQQSLSGSSTFLLTLACARPDLDPGQVGAPPVLDFELVAEIATNAGPGAAYLDGSTEQTYGVIRSLGWFSDHGIASLDLVTLTALVGPSVYSRGNPWLMQYFRGPMRYGPLPQYELRAQEPPWSTGTEPYYTWDDSPPHQAYPVDIDNDGDMDVVLKNAEPYGDAVEICRQDRGPSGNVIYTCANMLVMLGSMEIDVADMTHDGFVDIACVGSGFFQLWTNSGAGVFVPGVWADGVPTSNPGAVAVEPGTGQVAATDSTGLAVFELFAEFEIADQPGGLPGPSSANPSPPRTSGVGDLTVDVRYEFAGERLAGDLAWIDANGDAAPDLLVQPPATFGPLSALTLLVGSGHAGAWDLTPAWSVPMSDGDAPPCKGAAGYSPIGVGDFDLDGDEDFVFMFSETLTTVFYLNDGTGQFTADLELVDRASPLAVADRDGDGDLDLALIGCDGEVEVFDNRAITTPDLATP
jgi:FG-GAP-like repeat